MPEETRSPVPIFAVTLVAIAVLAVVGAVAGFYLGQRYRPRSQGVQVAQQPPPPSNPPPPVSTPAAAPPAAPPAPASKPKAKHASPSASSTVSGAGHGGLSAGHPPGGPANRKVGAAAVPHARTPHPAVTAKARHAPPGAARVALAKKPAIRSPRRAPGLKMKRLRPVAKLPPARAFPMPRPVRRERAVPALAALRPRPVRIASLPHARRRVRARWTPEERWRRRRPRIFSVAGLPGPVSAVSAFRFRSPTPLTPSPVLVRAAQRVRYVEQAVVLEGRPATLTTYIVWGQRQPRTFSFVRQDHRTDLARIVHVNEATRQVKVLVPSRGAAIQVLVPAAAVIAYGQALRTDPPSPELVARADSLLSPIPGTGPVIPPAAAAPPRGERVAGMREQMLELVGLVRRVDPVTRQMVLAGPRGKTPFRVAQGIDLPAVGQVISISTTPDARVLPRPALSVTPLQPTVTGVVTRVRPTAVELSVRTVTPEGQVQEVPVPVSGDARVFISDQPGDLRALKRGIFIRAYMTPTGETRILGLPSEAE